MSLSEEKREKRLNKKRRKAEAFLAVAELNDFDRAAAKRRKLGRLTSQKHAIFLVQVLFFF
jgi:hypothetical protein